LVFMNSSGAVWESLRNAVLDSGFAITEIDLFDKKHGTFKQFVSENTAGSDLVLHCRPMPSSSEIGIATQSDSVEIQRSVEEFIDAMGNQLPVTDYLHVSRPQELNVREIYSKWLSHRIAGGAPAADFAFFRRIVLRRAEEITANTVE
jgi:hypothetical protein